MKEKNFHLFTNCLDHFFSDGFYLFSLKKEVSLND